MLRRLPAPYLPPRLFLQKLLPTLRSIMMQPPPIPRNRLPIARVPNDIAMLANLHSTLFQNSHAVAIIHFAEQSRADKRFDLEVVVFGIVDDAAVESFAGALRWSGEEAGGAMGEPVDADGADGVVAGPVVEEGCQCFAACHFEELVGVEEAHPCVFVAVHLYACGVVFLLDAFSVTELVGLEMGLEVNPGDGGGGNGVGCSGEWWLGAVIEDVEAADAVVVVIVDEEFGEINGLVLHYDVGLVY